ncbi:MAG: acetamidase/formamidase family protein [Alphaproteobacteria bacterium]|nr:acetamidase/formamidase family protein [Alphaproteobacteria bacterium]
MAHEHVRSSSEAEPAPAHACGGLFGCGDEKGTGVVREDIKDGAFDRRAADRLLHMEQLEQERLDGFLTARGRARRQFLRASSFMSALAAAGPGFSRLAGGTGNGGPSPAADAPGGGGRVHTVPSTKQTVRLGVFDANLPPILTIESGDRISFPNTWSHFLNEMQPGVPVARLAELRTSNPGRGPHSIIGPVAVKDAQPGDVLEIRYRRLRPVGWGAVFNNPASLDTGLLPQDFQQGQVKYLDLDLTAMRGKFAPEIDIPLSPFQGTLGVAPPDGFFAPLSPGVTSSVPPGPHGGNLDLRELTEGSTLYLPVWHPGALIYTGDSHAVQGDGEISLTALETAMQEMLIEVVLHKQKNFRWPVAETQTHWITLGLDKDLNTAMTLAARNAIEFLATRAGLTRHDAYALCSIAASFRVTQVVDIVRGVHAMIPKSLFSGELRRRIAVV